MSRLIWLALYIAIPAALIPTWKYFAIYFTVKLMLPYKFSENAIVAVSTSVMLLPIFVWLASAIILVFNAVKKATM